MLKYLGEEGLKESFPYIGLIVMAISAGVTVYKRITGKEKFSPKDQKWCESMSALSVILFFAFAWVDLNGISVFLAQAFEKAIHGNSATKVLIPVLAWAIRLSIIEALSIIYAEILCVVHWGEKRLMRSLIAGLLQKIRP